jgi:hypothetical protein
MQLQSIFYQILLPQTMLQDVNEHVEKKLSLSGNSYLCQVIMEHVGENMLFARELFVQSPVSHLVWSTRIRGRSRDEDSATLQPLQWPLLLQFWNSWALSAEHWGGQAMLWPEQFLIMLFLERA